MSVNTNILNILPNGKLEGATENDVMQYIPYLPKKQISDERIRHMHGVAELMYNYAETFHVTMLKPDECYFLGLIHDIGYIYGKDKHELLGGALLSDLFDFQDANFVCHAIMWHGRTPKDYMNFCGYSEEEIPKELVLLWWADMNVESAGEHAGEVVGFQGRLDSLKERYGTEGKPYKICKETIEWLVDYMLRYLR